ncbi:hypothetical protein WR25_15993 [Diploscapter pachys]|uniref:Uncharacterized protein n=1 Tax=Diploscapter pachys TaxID=2018661 RepID=A0A2A2M0P4_9BILA|nr:hypothetical protein WR25_15993 [Diploscapter pachys]
MTPVSVSIDSVGSIGSLAEFCEDCEKDQKWNSWPLRRRSPLPLMVEAREHTNHANWSPSNSCSNLHKENSLFSPTHLKSPDKSSSSRDDLGLTDEDSDQERIWWSPFSSFRSGTPSSSSCSLSDLSELSLPVSLSSPLHVSTPQTSSTNVAAVSHSRATTPILGVPPYSYILPDDPPIYERVRSDDFDSESSTASLANSDDEYYEFLENAYRMTVARPMREDSISSILESRPRPRRRNSTALTVPNYTTELTVSGSGSDSDDTAEMDYFGEDVRTSSMGSSNSQASAASRPSSTSLFQSIEPASPRKPNTPEGMKLETMTLHKDWPGTSALTEIWVDEASGDKYTVEVRMYDTF